MAGSAVQDLSTERICAENGIEKTQAGDMLEDR